MRFANIIKSAAVVAALVAGQAHAAPIELVNNGSFESIDGHTSLASGKWNIYNNITGWTGIGNGIEVRNNVAGTAFDGKYFVELDTRANSAMQQSILTTAGKNYTLSFAFENRPGVALSSEGIEVFWNGLSQGVYNNSTNWKTVTLNVQGIAGSSVLKFAAVGKSDSYGTSLDKVSLVAAPVPEPETYAMLLAGLAMVGVVARRRKAA
ncbi:FxDxF family PEP-CTERM protein [Duganella fentianensis]|uniref:FxDxF family PEP-CTERM protein n=1 Tax=Duganella fentianensis TaxID=2692177 RepID=UPI0032B2A316